jgi:type I restriction enzyme S subunit
MIRPLAECIDTRYLLTFLESSVALGQAHSGTQGIGVPDLGLGEIKRFRIPIPPFAEQQRIVAKLDELAAVTDALERSLTAVETGRVRLLEAVLHDALAEGSVNPERSLADARCLATA